MQINIIQHIPESFDIFLSDHEQKQNWSLYALGLLHCKEKKEKGKTKKKANSVEVTM